MVTSNTIRELTDDSDCYYFEATKGQRYTFDVLDYNSYASDRITSGSSVSQSDLISAKVSIYIAGACPANGTPDSAGLVESKNYFSKTNHEFYFTCEKDAYYVLRVERASGYPQPGDSYGLSYRQY